MKHPIKACESNKYEPVKKLASFPINPRRPLTATEIDKLDKSLMSLGLFRPLLVWYGYDLGRPYVIGGNQRLKRLRILIERGHELVSMSDSKPLPGIPVTVFHGDETEAKTVALRDNNSEGDWDWEALSDYSADLRNMMSEVGNEHLDMDLTGFDEDIFKNLSNLANEEIVLDFDPDNRNAEPEEEKVKGKQKYVNVSIGQVKGRISPETYKMLADSLLHNFDSLDDGFKSLLEDAGWAG